MQLYRGDPERYDEKTLRVFQGSAVRVHLGGDFSASWCIFTQPEQTIQAFLSDLDNPRNRIRTIGGFVLVLGGTLRLIGCIMYRFQPYGLAIVNNMNIGRDVLVVAGNAVLAGWYACMGNLMTASINVGTGAAVLGGTMTLAGGAVVNGGVLNAHWGTGQLCFVGGGTLVTVGFHNVGAFTAIMRAGAGQFGTGAGALIHIGHLQPRAWGVASVFNAGQTHFCGAGLLHKHGENIATTAINHFFAGAGAHFYRKLVVCIRFILLYTLNPRTLSQRHTLFLHTTVGSGDSTWVGVSAGRSTVAQSLSGLGGIYYVGAGTTNHIGLPAAGFAVVRTRFMLGGELFTGGGSVNWINCKRYGAQVVDAWFGLGTNVFNGGGGVVFVNTKTKTVRRKYFPFPKNPGAIWVGGTKVGGAASNNDIFASGIGGVRPLGGAHNKTRYFMGRNRRVQMLQRRRLQQQDPVTPTVVAVGEASPEASRNSLLLVRSSIEEEVREGLVGPEQLVAALHGMETIGELLARLDDDTAVPTGPTQVAVSEDTQCLVCGAAPVEQVGRGACQVSDACTAAEPAEALLQAQTAAAAGGVALPASVATTTDLLGTLGGVDAAKDGEALPDLFYMWHELAVYCTAGAGGGIADCVSEAGLKQAVKAWLAGAVGQDSGFSVAAASTAVPAAVAHLADDALLSATHRARRSLQQADAAAATTDGCAAEGTRFNVYVTTIDAGLQKPLRTAWAALVKDPEPVRAALGGPAGPCALTAARKAAIVYPPIERMEPFQPEGLGLVGPSVIVGSGAAIAPVDHVVRGQPYRLFLQNFPGGMPAELRLVSASAAAAAGNAAAGLEGVPLATVGSFDDDGVTELAWTVAEDLPEGRYYVRAAAGPGGALFGTSQPFSIVAAPLTGAARRLRFG